MTIVTPHSRRSLNARFIPEPRFNPGCDVAAPCRLCDDCGNIETADGGPEPCPRCTFEPQPPVDWQSSSSDIGSAF